MRLPAKATMGMRLPSSFTVSRRQSVDLTQGEVAMDKKLDDERIEQRDGGGFRHREQARIDAAEENDRHQHRRDAVAQGAEQFDRIERRGWPPPVEDERVDGKAATISSPGPHPALKRSVTDTSVDRP